MNIPRPRLQDNLYICPACEGEGRVYIDKADPYEGHKLSRVADCSMCGGRKQFKPDTAPGEAVEAYWTKINEWRLREYQKHKLKLQSEKEFVESIVSNLTKEQLAILRKHLLVES